MDLNTVRAEVERQVGTGPDQKMLGNIPYTPRVKKVLALAEKEAKALQSTPMLVLSIFSLACSPKVTELPPGC